MDSYQPIYDAVSSKIGRCDIGSVLERVAFEAFDFSHQKAILVQEFMIAAGEMGRPSVVFKPTLSVDGDHWCVLLGDDLVNGVAGFGETPAKAYADFDVAFYKAQTPAAVRKTVAAR